MVKKLKINTLSLPSGFYIKKKGGYGLLYCSFCEEKKQNFFFVKSLHIQSPRDSVPVKKRGFFLMVMSLSCT